MPRVVSLADYKKRQERIGARVGARALALVRPLLGEKVSRSDVRAIAAGVFDMVVDGRVKSAALGAEFYQSQRAEYLEALPELVAPVERYSVSDLARGLGFVMVPGREFTNDTGAATTVSRHVKSGARRQVVGLSLVDAQSVGWARTSGGTTSCSFCLMLISRGPVYRSRESAGDMKSFHNRCDCVVAPVFDKKSFPGRDEFLSAEKLWSSSTGGKSGADALKAFRAAVTRNAPGGQDAVAA